MCFTAAFNYLRVGYKIARDGWLASQADILVEDWRVIDE